MDREDVINQLKSLIDDRKSFFDNDGDDEIFRADAKALEKAIEIIKGNNLDERNIYRQAIEKWGAEGQITMVFEEMADVEIMLEQMKILYNAENLVESNKKYKLKRLADRVGEIRKCRVCGCTDFKACEGGCYWVEDDLCSKCAEVKKDELHEDSNN